MGTRTTVKTISLSFGDTDGEAEACTFQWHVGHCLTVNGSDYELAGAGELGLYVRPFDHAAGRAQLGSDQTLIRWDDVDTVHVH